MSSLRTIIVALAVPVSNEQESYPAIEQCLAELGLNDVQIVSVLDASKPEHNYEPQIFSSYFAGAAGAVLGNDKSVPVTNDNACVSGGCETQPGTPADPDGVAYAHCGC